MLFEQFALFGGQIGDTRAESLTAGIGLVLKPILGIGSQLEEQLVVENELAATRRITAMGERFEIGNAKGPGLEIRAGGVFSAFVPDEEVGLLHNVCDGTCVPDPRDQRSDVGVQRRLNHDTQEVCSKLLHLPKEIIGAASRILAEGSVLPSGRFWRAREQIEF